MNLTVSNIYGIIQQGLIFAGVGMSLATANIFLERKKGRKLAIDTAFIQTDTLLLSWFSELQQETRDKNIAMIEYGQLVRATDQLVGLQTKLQNMFMHKTDNKEYEKNTADILYSLLSEIITNFRLLKKETSKNLQPKEHLQVIDYCKRIFEVKIHWYVSSSVDFYSIFDARATQRMLDQIAVNDHRSREEIQKEFEEYCKEQYKILNLKKQQDLEKDKKHFKSTR